MTGEPAGKFPDSAVGNDFFTLIRSLDREEILEVLSGSGGDGERFCQHCQGLLETRVHGIRNQKVSELLLPRDKNDKSEALESTYASSLISIHKSASSISISSRSPWQDSSPSSSTRAPQSIYSVRNSRRVSDSSPASVTSVNNERNLSGYSGSDIFLNNGLSKGLSVVNSGLSEDQNDQIRISQVGRKKNFIYNERVNGKMANVLQGLELHTGVFNSEEQKMIVECVYHLQHEGQKGQLRERTYSEPRKWMRGKGRVTIQFGCCYNYAMDKDGNPPGIIRDEEVDPFPPLFKQMIKRMVQWHVLPPTCIPNSCIVNIYDEGDCIPPHIDHHDFLRPFCTVSFLAECNILFGLNLKTVGPGEFSGAASISLPVGSVLILNGNGADVAKHCVPSVPAKRISITFRRMDDSKLPYQFLPDPELLGINPITPTQYHDKKQSHGKSAVVKEKQNDLFVMESDDFPPLGGSVSANRSRANKHRLRQ